MIGFFLFEIRLCGNGVFIFIYFFFFAVGLGV